MDYRDYVDDRTFRGIEESRRQILAGAVTTFKFNQPTFDMAAMYQTAFDPMEKLREQTGRQAADVLGTAAKASTQLQGIMGPSITAQAAMQGLFPRPDLPAQLRATLDLGFKSQTIASFLASAKGASEFSFQGSAMAKQLGNPIDTKALMGFGEVSATAGHIAEQWRLANTGALSNFGESFNSLSAALDFNESLKASQLAQAVLREAWKLGDAQADRWAEADLTESAETCVEEELQADQNLAEVVGVVQQYFVVYLGYTPEQAHNLVRRIVWILLFGTIVSNVLWGAPAVAASIGAISAATSKLSADSLAVTTANALIPDGVPDTTT